MPEKVRKKRVIPRRSPAQDRSKETVDAIMEATAQILPRLGLARTSTNKIAERAGVSVGSIYQYFPNRQAIFNYLIDREISRHFEVLSAKMEAMRESPLEELVAEILSTVVELFTHRKRLRAMLFNNMGEFPAASRIQETEDRFQEMLIRLMRERAEEISRPDHPMAAFVLVHSVMGTVRASLYEHREVDDEAMSRELCVMVESYLGVKR